MGITFSSKKWGSLPKINVILVDKGILELVYECRENDVYIPGTLKLDFFLPVVDRNRCILDFRISSISENALSSQAC